MAGIISDRFDEMLEAASNILASGDEQATLGWCEEYRRFSAESEQRLAAHSGSKTSVEFGMGARQRQFALHLLEPLQAFFATLPRNTLLDGLDAECGHGHGTDLIASLYLTATLGYRLRMAACTANPSSEFYAMGRFRSFVVQRKPLAQLARKFDVVFSMFHLQRLADVADAARLLQRLATRRVFVLAPFEEPEEKLTRGHRSVITEPLLEQLGAEAVEVMTSPAWGGGALKVVRFQLPGLGG